MTGAERTRLYRLKRAAAAPVTKPVTKSAGTDHAALARAKARIAALEQELAALKVGRRDQGQGQGQLRTQHGRLGEGGEVGKLRGENATLRSDILKLKAMLQEEPDAAKLRKKVIDQQVELASLRRVVKQIGKERDRYQRRAKPKYRSAERLLTRTNYGVLIKSLHPDRSGHVTAAELAAAERLAIGLRPLFVEDEAQNSP
jgi:chromosome segregation ATPase